MKWPNDVYAFYTANCDLNVDYIVFRPIESTGGIAYLEEHKAVLYTVNRAMELSDPVTVEFTPLESSISKVSESSIEQPNTAFRRARAGQRALHD